MHARFRLNTLRYGLALAFPALAHTAFAAEPYPALPPTLSSSVKPNVLLHIDNSGSMDDAPASGGSKRKMDIAKEVAKDLIVKNPDLRWGLFSFDTGKNQIDNAGILQAPVGSSTTTLNSAIDGLDAATWTPLGETMVEITRYFGGQSSYYGKTKNTTSGTYSSPIQYRCQKNFAIVITDGDSTKDDSLPGVGKSAIAYTSYDTANKAVSKSFEICQSTSTKSSVTCPAVLEGSSNSSDPFMDKNKTTYLRSIRDAAMYAYDADFRVGGTDLDNKSFDDPKFIKQNLTTYTVGFDVNNEVLAATATVGHGKYYTAGNQTQLTTALSNAVSDIVASVSNAGGVATQSETTSAGNKVFQPVFNPKGWYGELRCYNLDGSGNFNPNTSQCTPNGKAVIPAAANRKLYSAAVSNGTTTAFDFGASPATVVSNMTTAQQNALGTNATDRQNVVRFLRGETVTNYRTRSNGLLGDIVDSQPVVISRPNGQTPDVDYPAFKTSNADRNMVFIGANDGMLHGFSIANMTEIMGFIPSSVYPHLLSLSKADYGDPGGTAHTYHVNGSMRWADVKLGNNWKTLLVGGLGQGGQGYFAIDATNGSNFSSAANTVKWEWTDQNKAGMGYSFGTPLIYSVRTSATTVVPAVILSNGYESDYDDGTKANKSSSLYVINASTGALLKEIVVAGGAGLSSPAGVDAGQDGVLDYVYAGDANGKLWRFDLTTDTPDGFSVAANPVFDAGPTHPIVMRPAAMILNRADNSSLGNLVLFGTGRLLTDADRTDTTTQSLYGIVDYMEATPRTIPRSELQVQTIDATATVSDSNKRVGSYRKMSTNLVDLQTSTSTGTMAKGWYIDLANTERLVTSPMIYDDKVLFGTGITQSSEACLPGGKGWIMGLNPLTGSVTTKNNDKNFARAYSFVDVVPDLRSTVDDKVAFSTGSAYASGYDKSGIPTELTYVGSDAKLVTPPAQPGASDVPIGQVIAQREANSMAVYVGNARPGVSTFAPIPRPASTGKGTTYTGTIGDDKVDKDTLLGPASGAKVETLIWREIK
ncbi:PilC/PilY family type IV pilus protein [Jeongeupia naejangsanensis]|uniref:PilY1 beta-propeller domain-containing protein n=1 Tax=Jeongeupia naejangsanensis TaxID=613195 RepID=A0ABS2BNT0_9NEIS|nr:PilC/PilY family type IV pilus protein [Jeongeupia naejangsanensis]MBM3116449.1 hypothetical protein [Jeongeupia naejangsanensis]